MKNKKIINTISSLVGIIICLVFIPIMVLNITLIIKGYTNPNEIPSFFGITPIIETSEDMQGVNSPIMKGNLVFVSKSNNFAKDDIVAIKVENGVALRRVASVISESGTIKYQVKGDGLAKADNGYIDANQIIGTYKMQFGKMGNLIIFSQQPLGIILFIGLPMFMIILFDLLLHRKTDDKQKELEKSSTLIYDNNSEMAKENVFNIKSEDENIKKNKKLYCNNAIINKILKIKNLEEKK